MTSDQSLPIFIAQVVPEEPNEVIPSDLEIKDTFLSRKKVSVAAQKVHAHAELLGKALETLGQETNV